MFTAKSFHPCPSISVARDAVWLISTYRGTDFGIQARIFHPARDRLVPSFRLVHTGVSDAYHIVLSMIRNILLPAFGRECDKWILTLCWGCWTLPVLSFFGSTALQGIASTWNPIVFGSYQPAGFSSLSKQNQIKEERGQAFM